MGKKKKKNHKKRHDVDALCFLVSVHLGEGRGIEGRDFDCSRGDRFKWSFFVSSILGLLAGWIKSHNFSLEKDLFFYFISSSFSLSLSPLF